MKIEINEPRLRQAIREALEQEPRGTVYYRGFKKKFGPGYLNGRFTHGPIWVTPHAEYAKMYGDAIAEIMIDESRLKPASLSDIDELVDYDFEYDGLAPEDQKELLNAGFNCYELEYNSFGSSGIYLMDPGCITGIRIMSDEERNAVENWD